MKAVVLVAGKGTRMAKHHEGPKHLLPVNGKPVVERFLDALPDVVDSLALVVGGPHEQAIRDHFSSGTYNERPIEFVVQDEQLGLAHAFWCAADVVKGTGKWMGAIGDDLLDAESLAALADQENAVLAYRTEHPENFGVLVTDDEDNLVRSVEKPQEFISDLVWTGHMVMDEDFFEARVEPSDRGEYETPDVWMKLMNDYSKKIKVVTANMWLPINDKDQLEEAEAILGETS